MRPLILTTLILVYCTFFLVANSDRTTRRVKEDEAGERDRTEKKNRMSTDDFAVPDFDGSRYSNPASFTNWTGVPGPLAVLKFGLFEKDESNVPKDEKELNRTVPVVPLTNFQANSSLFASWLGHATVLVGIDGAKVITDPVWAQRASPIGFTGPKRYRPSPCAIEELPELDIGVISHDHYDHLDVDAVKKLTNQFPNMRWFVPLGMDEWMAGVGIENTDENPQRVTAMNWGDSQNVTIRGEKFTVWCVPAQHWCQRGAFDRNKRLWSGWVVEGPTKKFLYTGDTGFCSAEYEKIGKKFGGIDLAAIPIGCYAPRWFMKSQHIDVEEAAKIHEMIGARTSIGIHWGTYHMGSLEYYLHPKEWLNELSDSDKIKGGKFITVDMGEIWSDSQ